LRPLWPQTSDLKRGLPVKSVSAREAKYNFGKLIDTARAEPVVIEKHGRAVVVVVAVEEFERLTGRPIPERPQDMTEKKN
jgi:prevent-host-death family protein